MKRECTEGDEILERLWSMKESGRETIGELREALGDLYDEGELEGLVSDGFVRRQEDRVSLTQTGLERARRLVRAHRLGERLIHDVLGKDYEPGACEFEHIVDTGIVDGICTLLGHPRECPHGYPIPEGECCRKFARFAGRHVVPLTEMEVGQSARIAYVYAKSDREMHRLASLEITPGATVKLHQKSPAFVVECEGASIALDDEVAGGINVWTEGEAVFVPHEAGERARGGLFAARNRRRWRGDRQHHESAR
jgi:DtxR family Mn-dependent transcriptional regulator